MRHMSHDRLQDLGLRLDAWKAGVHSTCSLDLSTAYDTGLRLAASVRVAKRNYVFVHELTIWKAVCSDDDDSSVISACQFTNHWFAGLPHVAGKGLHPPKPAPLLSCD